MTVNRRMFLAAGFTVPFYAASPLQVFTAEEARIVEALCDQIIPADDVAGARAAGVLYYIDRQLAGPLNRFRPRYTAGLPAFAALPGMPFEQQTAFLHALRGDELSFFNLVVDHTMQGFYGSPVHGGNRDEASWKMLGVVDMMGGHGH